MFSTLCSNLSVEKKNRLCLEKPEKQGVSGALLITLFFVKNPGFAVRTIGLFL